MCKVDHYPRSCVDHRRPCFSVGGSLLEEGQVGVCELSLLPGIEKERIIQIACGESHSLALTSKGQVFSWGSNGEGQLGLGPDEHIAGPAKVSGLAGFHCRISQIACGDVTSFALGKDGSVSIYFKMLQFLHRMFIF